ncbi:MAG: tripartite tricarboxylate transporter TctB family protein [Oscillospiraceae bacterium]|nr:tripartite tricarboxylate transporter TctB family protein [Oscillospiraceae bacterium]
MKWTDIGVVAFMYIICAVFYYKTVHLNEEIQSYPKFTVILLFGLTTMYLVQMLLAAKRNGVESGVDKVFKDFQPAQFFVSLAAVVAYVLLINVLGFYIATALFLIGLLLYLKVPYLATAITVAVILALVYFAFAKFLGVKLPKGLLLKMLK